MLYSTRLRIGVLIVFLCGFLGLVGAYVALIMSGHGKEAAGLFPAAASILAAAGIIGHQQVVTSGQDAALRKIEHQTNGALTRRIHEGSIQAARIVMAEAGLNVPPPSAPIPALPATTGTDGKPKPPVEGAGAA